MSCYYDASSTRFLGDMMQGDMQKIYGSFLERLPEKGIILDAGCGSGRDSLFFKEKGYMIMAMDTSEQICQMASEHIGQAVLFCRFQDAHFKISFDGYLVLIIHSYNNITIFYIFSSFNNNYIFIKNTSINHRITFNFYGKYFFLFWQ